MDATASRIVVGYDGSPDADLALTWAAETAKRRGLALDAVVVAAATEPLVGDPHELLDHMAAEASERAKELLKSLDVKDGAVALRRGPVVASLLAVADGAEMLVVGSRGHGLLFGSLTGSVSQHLARHASCPVVVVRHPQMPEATRIVVGMDGSSEGKLALRFGCAMAAGTGQQLVVLHGYRALRSAFGAHDSAFARDAAHRIANADRLVRDWIAEEARSYQDLDITAEAVAAAPDRMLVDASAAASLVVVGARGLDAFADLLLGSVSQRVLHDAHCPVAVVREAADHPRR